MNKMRYYGLWTMAYFGAYFGFASYIKIHEYSPLFRTIGFILFSALYLWGCRFDDCKNG